MLAHLQSLRRPACGEQGRTHIPLLLQFLPLTPPLTRLVSSQTTSLLTIGYGDVVVKTRGMDRLLDTLLILLGLVAVTMWATCTSRAARSIGRTPTGGQGVWMEPCVAAAGGVLVLFLFLLAAPLCC